MKNIHISFMKNLRNIEFEELFDIVSTIVAAENIGLPTLTMACEQLQPHAQELSKMNNQKIKHPLTPIIREQVNTRTEYLACLRMTVDANLLWHKPEQRVAAERPQFWLKSYKDDIYAPTISTQSAMVENLMADRREDATIKAATALLDLDDLLDEIVKLTANIRRNQLARINDKDIYEVDGQAMRKAAYKDLKVLVTVIDSSYRIGANEKQRDQLAALSSTLNASLQDFRTLLKSRNTKRKNKKGISVAAAKELKYNEAKEPEPQLDNNKLPMVIYDELPIPATFEAPNLYMSSHTCNGTTSTQPSKTKDTANDKKSVTNNWTVNSSSSSNKDKKKKGGEGKLPPISINLVISD